MCYCRVSFLCVLPAPFSRIIVRSIIEREPARLLRLVGSREMLSGCAIFICIRTPFNNVPLRDADKTASRNLIGNSLNLSIVHCDSPPLFCTELPIPFSTSFAHVHRSTTVKTRANREYNGRGGSSPSLPVRPVFLFPRHYAPYRKDLCCLLSASYGIK